MAKSIRTGKAVKQASEKLLAINLFKSINAYEIEYI